MVGVVGEIMDVLVPLTEGEVEREPWAVKRDMRRKEEEEREREIKAKGERRGEERDKEKEKREREEKEREDRESNERRKRDKGKRRERRGRETLVMQSKKGIYLGKISLHLLDLFEVGVLWVDPTRTCLLCAFSVVFSRPCLLSRVLLGERDTE